MKGGDTMLFASDARIVANKIDSFRPYMLRDLDNISERIYEAAKSGEYRTEYEVSYEDEMFVKLLGEELKNYGYVFTYRQAYLEGKAVFIVMVNWEDDSDIM